MTRRVLVVSHEASRTGAPRVAMHLLNALAAGGWETVLVHRWGGPMAGELDEAASRSFLEPGARLRVALQRWRVTKRASASVERWAVDRTLRRVAPDLVWCNTVITAGYASAAIRAGIPVVVHSHEARPLVAKALDKWGLREQDLNSPLLRLVGCGTDTARTLAAELGVEADDVAVLHSPVDVTALRSEAAATTDPYRSYERPVVVACGVGDERKGVDTFAAASMESTSPSWVWVGRVPEEDRGGRVSYVGEQQTAVGWIAHADLVALPSRADPFPLVVLEAMALGVPVVASDLDGTREQLGDGGVFVPVGDSSRLAGEVDGLIALPEHLSELGAGGRRRCETLWDVGPFAEKARAIADGVAGR